MENEYFRPNPALKSASITREQRVGQQQADLDMQAAQAMRMTADLAAQDELAMQREAEMAQPQGLGAPMEAPAGAPAMMQENNQGLGVI